MPRTAEALQVPRRQIMPRELGPSDLAAIHALLEACRDHVHHWSGVQTILASYQVDPGRLGRCLIKHRPGAAWRCGRCGRCCTT